LKEIGPSSEILENIITSCDLDGTLLVMSGLLPHKHEVRKFKRYFSMEKFFEKEILL
jgi:hypothetical protein